MWRIFQAPSMGDAVIVGLERISQRRRLLWRETRIEERTLSREFHEREIVAIAGYHALLEEVVHYLAEGTFGSFVEVDAVDGGVRVCLFRRRLTESTCEVEIACEKEFTADQIADSAAYAEEVRAQADEENRALWEQMRETEARAEAVRASAEERAREAAELASILRDEGRS